SVELINLIVNGAGYFFEFIRWSALFVFSVLLMSEISATRKFSNYVGYFVAGYFISSVFGLLYFYYGGFVDDGMNPNRIRRFSGLSGDPNSYGMYALLVLSFLLLKLESVSGLKGAI